MGAHLNLRPAHSRKNDDGQKFARLAVQTLARHKVGKTKFGQKARHRLGKFLGQPRISVFDLGAVEGFLQGKPLLNAVLFRHGRRVGKRERNAPLRKDFVHRRDGVKGLGKSDERRALIDRLTDLFGRASDVEARPDVRFQLRQRLIDDEHRDRDQLAHLVVERTRIAHFAEDETLQYAHESGVTALVHGRLAAEELGELFLASFHSVHTSSVCAGSSPRSFRPYYAPILTPCQYKFTLFSNSPDA